MFIRTKQFAELLGISEGELVHCYQSGGRFKGLDLPESMYQYSGNSRRFRLGDAVAFAEKVKRLI